jgi:hypothetical protein
MTTQDILRYRLYNQQLAQPKFTTPQQLVAWFGGVQSQDYSGAKWAIAQRLLDGTDERIEKAFTDGEILRTHALRPTWHFVAPLDIRWMMQLNAPRVKAFMGAANRDLGLTKEVYKQTQQVIQKALTGGKSLTRNELGAFLQENHLPGVARHLAHVAMEAELDGLICSGPRRGKQFTYMLLEERVAKTQELSRDEALAELAKRYFISHGPATIKDFVWWSGLTVGEAKHGLAQSASSLHREVVDNKEYWFADIITKPMPNGMYLLPNFDENAIAYKERDLFYNPADDEHLDSRGNAIFQHMIMFEGKGIGLWRRTLKTDTVIITLGLYKKLSAQETKLLHEAFDRYGKFIQKKVVLT